METKKQDHVVKKVSIVKGTMKKIDSGSISEEKARMLAQAIENLNNWKLNQLRIMGKVSKFTDDHHNPLFVYRMGWNDRIIFSVENNGNITIRDVVDLREKKSVLKSR